MRRKLMCMLPVLFATFIFAVSLFAQSAAPLRGQVLDELGAVIPGAHVTLIRADGNQRTTVTDVTGEFTFPNVAPGTYTLIVKFEGFQTYTEKDLSFPLAASPLRITLRVAPLREEIEVSTETQGVSVEPDQNLSAIILDEAFIQTLPDNEEDLRSFLLALAGPSAGGASGGQGEAQIYVDGFPGGRLPPREAIMQIRINQNPFSAEYSYPGMGRIEIITRPGTDQWRGNVGFSFRNSAIDARNAFAQTKPDLDQKRYSFNFSGPLLPKKMSFFANVERRQLHGSGTVRAETLDGPFVANVPAPSANTSFFLRSSYLINQKNTLNIGYSFTTSESKNREFVARFGGFGPPGGFGGGGGGGGNNYTLPERGSNSENTNQTLQLAETFLMSTRLIHETRLRFQREQSASTANTQGVAINVLDAFNGGGSTCCPNESRQNTLDFQDYLTYTYKTHMIKGGFQLQYENNRDLNGSNFNGTYTFSSLDQYRRVLAGEHVDPEDPTSPLVRPTQFTINRGDPLLRYSQYQASWFLQDDWRVRPTLTLSVGLRHEFQAHLDDKVNFAPRLGIAWSPLKDRKTTVRAGGGLFFSRLSGGLYANTLRYDGVTQQSIVIRHPLYPDPFAGNPDIEVTNTIKRTLDPNLKAPYTINFTSSLERQLPLGLVTSVTYIYAKGVHQFRSRNINAPLPGTDARPDPSQGNIYQLESSAQSQYHGFLFRVDRRWGRLFTVFSNYTLSWTRSDADGPQSLPADNYNLRSEWGPALTDRRHFLFVGGNVTLPYGLRLMPFVNASSGTPFNITTGFDDNHDTVINDRPPGVNRNSDLPASLYSLLPDYCVANCGPGQTPLLLRDYLAANYPNGVHAVGPGSFNVNLSVSKTFGIGHRNSHFAQSSPGGLDQPPPPGAGGPPGGGRPSGFGGGGGPFGGGSESSRFNLTLSVQITNLFNHVNLGQYSGVLSSPFFGRSNSAGAARQFEFNLRFNF